MTTLRADFGALARRRLERVARAQRLHAFLASTGTTLLALVCPFFWSLAPGALDLALLLAFYTATIAGITLGFHRLGAHKAFSAPAWVRGTLWAFGSAAAQGPLMYWVSNHRRHHRFSDLAGDPHSPHVDGEQALVGLRGFWHAHVGWMFSEHLTDPLEYTTDLYRDPVARFVNRRYAWWVALGVLLPGAIALALTTSPGAALRAVYWAAVVRHALSFHATSGINSLTHLFGARQFSTNERSRNNVLLVLPTLGEGWHNNHHAFPSSAKFGLAWHQLDLGWLMLRAASAARLVSGLKRPSARALARAPREGAAAHVTAPPTRHEELKHVN